MRRSSVGSFVTPGGCSSSSSCAAFFGLDAEGGDIGRGAVFRVPNESVDGQSVGRLISRSDG